MSSVAGVVAGAPRVWPDRAARRRAVILVVENCILTIVRRLGGNVIMTGIFLKQACGVKSTIALWCESLIGIFLSV